MNDLVTTDYDYCAQAERTHSPTHAVGSTRSVNLRKILALVRAHPGIRPSELNRLLNLEQSDDLRNALIRRGLIREERDGSAMRYYLV